MINADYVSWLPTVSGRLSFSVIGKTNWPSKANSANQLIGSTRYICAVQKRPALDSALPNFLQPIYAEYRGVSRNLFFVFLGKGTENKRGEVESITGTVFIFASKASWYGKPNKRSLFVLRTKGLRSPENVALNLVETIDKAKKDYKESSKFDFVSFENSIQRAADFLTGSCGFLTTVSITRDGIFRSKRGKYGRGLNLIDTNEEKNLNQNLISRYDHLSYFFLRDIVHEHQHHDPDTDTILTLYSRQGRSWKYLALRSLLRSILRNKRSRVVDEYSRAKGIHAYARSFVQNVIGVRDRKTRPLTDLVEKIESDTLLLSLESAREMQEFRLNTRRGAIRLAAYLTFSVVGLYIAIVGLARLANVELEALQHSVVLATAANLLISQFEVSAIVFFLLGRWLCVLAGYLEPIQDSPFFQNFARLWASRDQIEQSTISIAIGAFCIFLSVVALAAIAFSDSVLSCISLYLQYSHCVATDFPP